MICRHEGCRCKPVSRVTVVTVVRLAGAAAAISCVPIMCQQLLEDHWIQRVSSDFMKKKKMKRASRGSVVMYICQCRETGSSPDPGRFHTFRAPSPCAATEPVLQAAQETVQLLKPKCSDLCLQEKPLQQEPAHLNYRVASSLHS